MSAIPATLNLQGRRVLLVGNGEQARCMGASLQALGAQLRLVAPSPHRALLEAAQQGGWELLRRGFREGDLDGCCLAVAAADSADVNRGVVGAADRRGCLVHALGCIEGSSLRLGTPSAPRVRRRCRAGHVYLVGAGPGDPGLLTQRAREVMAGADTVLYDRLVAPALLELVNPAAERIYVGKAASRHTVSQEEINERLFRLAAEGRRVLRLKGGDPFVFGRGGEEIERLKGAGVPFEVVPGITAALGCSAYAGIPLTHRDHAQVCTFVTGHLKQDDSLDLPWEALVQPQQTLVVYMGLGALQRLCTELMHHGLAASHPAAIIQRGTLDDQHVLVADLGSLPARAEAEGLAPPSLVIVGEVVRLRERLDWFSAPAHPATLDRMVG